MTDAELLSAAIRASHLSVRGFARAHFPLSHPRTIWRWLSGESPMSRSVRELCQRVIDEADAKQPEKQAIERAPP